MNTTSRTIDAVVFDLDGTLADTLRDIADAVNHALTAVDLPTQPADLIREWIGDGLIALCRRAMNGALPDKMGDVARIAGAYYDAHPTDHTELYPGIPELLDELTARGMPIGVLSNKPHVYTVPMVADLCDRWSFGVVEGCRDEVDRKPKPNTALRICAALGTPPESAVLLGDTAVDVQTARNAGMISVGATWGFRDVEVLREAGADHIIDEPGEFLAILDRCAPRER